MMTCSNISTPSTTQPPSAPVGPEGGHRRAQAVGPTPLHGRLWSVKELEMLWGVGRQTIQRWLKDGGIPSIRMGRRVFVADDVAQRIAREGYQLPDSLKRKS